MVPSRKKRREANASGSDEKWVAVSKTGDWKSPLNLQAGNPASKVARTFLSAGSGDFPVARSHPL